MIVALRHAETHDNDEKKFRGWSPVSITLDGAKDMHKTAELLAKQLTGADEPEAIYCCDLPRTVQSAHILGEALDMPIEPMKELRTFNVGDLTEKPVDDKNTKILHDHIRHPNKRIPGGNSYNGFKNRVLPILKRCVESEDCYVLVTHGMVLSLLAAICKSGNPDKPDLDTLFEPPPVDPAGFMIIGSDWKCHYTSAKAEASNQLS